MVGKQVARRLYAHCSLLGELPLDHQVRVNEAIRISGLLPGDHFNVARLDLDLDVVALLSYPGFFDDLYPSLRASWRVHLPTETVRFRDFSGSLNPPILHRKELMLPSNHPLQECLKRVTNLAESIGLFQDPVRIGFREQWNELVASKGYQVLGQELVPIGNVTDTSAALDSPAPTTAHAVRRHLTALSRNFLSAPVQALLRHNLLGPGRTFFDYGCGRGDDVESLRMRGFEARGWDPYFRPEERKAPATVVNLGFVINVIEDFGERVEALQGAYALTEGVLSIAAMLESTSVTKRRALHDGHLTSRNTFQKYFSQAELQTFIEGVLEEHAIPVAPGVFFVFKDRYLEQEFLADRQSDPSRVRRLLAFRAARAQETGASQPIRETRNEDPARGMEIEAIWQCALKLGRLPEEDEYPRANQASLIFGSWSRALRAVAPITDRELLEQAARARADEVRVFFALQAFSGRKRLRDFEPRLRRDIKAFFSSLASAEAEGQGLLRECADNDAIKAACERASLSGLGHLDGDHSLQLHTSLVARLDPVLRVYVGCATVLYGDVLSADVVKIHIQSRKLTLMKFDDFHGSPVPKLMQRVKVNLRRQELDLFEYGDEHPPPLLYFKSRYVNEEFPSFPEQQEFDRHLESLGLPMANGYGPSGAEFLLWLRAQRQEVQGMRLVRSTSIPSLDESCGRNFSFRELVQCGETWDRTRIANTPKSPDTYNALFDLASKVLDPTIEYFGSIRLTYGFASPALAKIISRSIAPRLDQHAACEVGPHGSAVCARQGAAVDFLVDYEDMLEVACWIAANCPFDRLYFYGKDRPIHVSYGPELSGEAFEMTVKNGRRIPRKLKL